MSRFIMEEFLRTIEIICQKYGRFCSYVAGCSH
jgi:hypothetical protein